MQKMLRADQLQPGVRVCVNDEWVPVDRLSPYEDGSVCVWWGGPRWRGKRGIRCKPETEFSCLLPNARFWVWENEGWVKLTLKPGQVLCYGGGAKHEEGFSWWHQEFEYDVTWPCVFSYHSTGGRDCDRPHESYTEAACLIENLQALPPMPADPEYQMDEIPVPRPDWQTKSQVQRDHFAEAAGY